MHHAARRHTPGAHAGMVLCRDDQCRIHAASFNVPSPHSNVGMRPEQCSISAPVLFALLMAHRVCRASRGQGGWCKPSPSCKPAVDGAAEARAQELQQSLQGKSVRHEAQAAQVAQERTLQLSRLRHRHQMIVSTKQQTFERRYICLQLLTCCSA